MRNLTVALFSPHVVLTSSGFPQCALSTAFHSTQLNIVERLAVVKTEDGVLSAMTATRDEWSSLEEVFISRQ